MSTKEKAFLPQPLPERQVIYGYYL